MQSTRHDANLAALQASTALPGQVVDVVVLTDDVGLLATVREASSPEHAIWHAASADLAVDLLVGGRCGILIADLGTLRGDSASLLERLHAQFPELILLATGRRDEEGAVSSLVSSGPIYRFLHKPISPARAGVFLSAATRRYQELRDVEPLALTTVKTIAASKGLGKVVAIALGIVAAVIAAVFWLSREDSTAISPPRPSQATTASTQEERIADLLERAQRAFAQNRLSEPSGDNALEHFRAVLALQPNRTEAREGADRVIAILEQHVIETLQARDAALGAIALRELQHAAPDDPKVETLHAQLLALSRSVRTPPPASPRAAAAAPKPKANTAPAASAPAPANQETAPAAAAQETVTQSEAESEPAPASSIDAEELGLIIRLRERGVLIEPAGSNAYDQFIALRERYPDAEEVRAEQQRLAFALLERARTALAAENVDAAAAHLNRVETLVPGMSTTKSLQQQLAIAQRQRDFMTHVVPATQLQRVREAAPVYPRDAQRNGIEGWVDVEFTVAADGTTQDPVVRNAEPKGIFEKAALESVQRWRFEPVMNNGVAVPQRAAIRVRFALQ